MRALVQESAQNYTLPAATVSPEGVVSGAVIIGPRELRPRLEGYEGSLRGAALSAKLADRATAVFQIRPIAATGALALLALANMQALLTIHPAPLLGGDVDDSGATAYPPIEVDVSGQLTLFRGRLAFDVQDWGVCKISLRLLNWAGSPQTVLVMTQILADVRVPQWERERLGQEEA